MIQIQRGYAGRPEVRAQSCVSARRMTGNSACCLFTKGMEWNKDVSAISYGVERCQMEGFIPFRHGGTHSIWCQISGRMSACISGSARFMISLVHPFAWNSIVRLCTVTEVVKSMLSRWMKRQISSHPNQCRARKARRNGLTLSFTPISAFDLTFGALSQSATEGDRTPSAAQQRDLSKAITPRLKFVHDPRRYSGCVRFQPAFGRVLASDSEAMPKREATNGEVMEGVMATYEHGEQAVTRVAADLREGIQEMVAVNLMPSTVWSLRFTGHGFPTIDNVELLRAEAQFWSLGEAKLKHLLQDTSPRTAVEAGTGTFQP
jgi:hypothetical protein